MYKLCVWFECKTHKRDEYYVEKIKIYSEGLAYKTPKYIQFKANLVKLISDCKYANELEKLPYDNFRKLRLSDDEFIKFVSEFLKYETPDIVILLFNNLNKKIKKLVRDSIVAIKNNDIEKFKEYIDLLKNELVKTNLW